MFGASGTSLWESQQSYSSVQVASTVGNNVRRGRAHTCREGRGSSSNRDLRDCNLQMHILNKLFFAVSCLNSIPTRIPHVNSSRTEDGLKVRPPRSTAMPFLAVSLTWSSSFTLLGGVDVSCVGIAAASRQNTSCNNRRPARFPPYSFSSSRSQPSSASNQVLWGCH